MVELRTAKQVVEQLRLPITAATLRKWAGEGRVPAKRVSHKVLLFDVSQVIAALGGNAVTAAPAILTAGENNVESGRDFQI